VSSELRIALQARIVSLFHGNGETIHLFVLAAFVRRQTIPFGSEML